MGFALADEAARRGARVTVVAANVALAATARRRVRRRRDRRRAARRLRCAPSTCRRPADGRRRRRLPARRPVDGKVKKDQQGESLALELERTTDVLSALVPAPRDGQR